MPLKWKFFISLLVVTLSVAAATLVWRLHRLSSVPPTAWHCLEAPQQMVLYSLHREEPGSDVQGAAIFHGCRILGEIPVTTESPRQRVASAVRHAVLTGAHGAVGFNPRHGVRVTDGEHTCDFVICFECRRLDYYLDNATVGSVPIGDSPEALNAILQEVHVPIAE